MLDEKGKRLISSLELQAKTGISRATMNNYIKMGIIPRPFIKKPTDKTIKAKKIGYFYDSVLEIVNQVRLYKEEGRSMKDIAVLFLQPANKFGEQDTNIVKQDNDIAVVTHDPHAVYSGTIPLDTPLLLNFTVLSACLNNSFKIRAELPADIYFKILLKLRRITEEIFKKFHCIIKRNSGDQIACYFFKNIDSNYLINTIECAVELKKRMIDVNYEIETNNEWLNTIFLNIGVCEGEEHIVMISSSLNDEIITIGDLERYALSLCEAGEPGSILTTKSLINKLSMVEKQKIRYGIRKKIDDLPIMVENIFSRIKDLLPHEDSRYKKFTEIHELVVTQILDFRQETMNSQRL
jgi:hypothetical protein